MNTTETLTGVITRNTRIGRFLVETYSDGDGKVSFSLLSTYKQDDVELGAATAIPFEALFSQLPTTFPVVINGQTVQVSGQTILDALDSVANTIMAMPEPGA